MDKYQYVRDFKALGFGMFVHYGIYSVIGKGEWALHSLSMDKREYEKLATRFKPKKNWAKEIVAAAKRAGCRYITLTTRHHDGFSLYDTKGLSCYDAPHIIKRDLVREFADACNEQGIVPMFYHTLLDWHNEDYGTNFEKYLDYLVKSVEILCTEYGKIGGLWFDGMWDKWQADWQEDRLYATIRKHQPTAMIINNTGLSHTGRIGHKELDSVTFERGKPSCVDERDRERAGEMCQAFNDHWGYAKNDINYKPISEILSNLVECRASGCNFLLNVGPMPNGSVRPIENEMLKMIGDWIRTNESFIYGAGASELSADGATVLYDGKYHYAVIKDVPMSADPDVAAVRTSRKIKLNGVAEIKNAVWLDCGKSARTERSEVIVEPYGYGSSYGLRVLRFCAENGEK